MNRNPNLVLTIRIAQRLEPLLPKLVFVGGCAAGLLITDPASAPIRPTRDVDVLAEIASYAEHTRFGDRLRKLGFREDESEGAPLCRWAIDDMLLDLMPDTRSVLGFTNVWYKPAIRHSGTFDLTDDLRIRLITSPYFLATKLEAFNNRGNRDYWASHDMEDIIAVVDGRPGIVEETRNADSKLAAHLAEQFRWILGENTFHDALPGLLLPDAASQA